MDGERSRQDAGLVEELRSRMKIAEVLEDVVWGHRLWSSSYRREERWRR